MALLMGSRFSREPDKAIAISNAPMTSDQRAKDMAYPAALGLKKSGHRWNSKRRVPSMRCGD
ncbi:hypothetical protein MishRS11D_44480 (plasmid) [Methylomagnum ishizawai]|nr:hypothetical protein MishRS11D_44480 [Methylomagnum ishizawai]